MTHRKELKSGSPISTLSEVTCDDCGKILKVNPKLKKYEDVPMEVETYYAIAIVPEYGVVERKDFCRACFQRWLRDEIPYYLREDVEFPYSATFYKSKGRVPVKSEMSDGADIYYNHEETV